MARWASSIHYSGFWNCIMLHFRSLPLSFVPEMRARRQDRYEGKQARARRTDTIAYINKPNTLCSTEMVTKMSPGLRCQRKPGLGITQPRTRLLTIPVCTYICSFISFALHRSELHNEIRQLQCGKQLWKWERTRTFLSQSFYYTELSHDSVRTPTHINTD